MTRALPSKFVQSMPEPDETVKAIRDTLVALKKNVEVLTGQVKPTGMTAVCWDDLIALGLADTNDLPTGGPLAPGGYQTNGVAQGAGVAMTNNIPLTIARIILPTADSYDVSFASFFLLQGSTTVTTCIAAISDTLNVVQATPLDRIGYLNIPAGGFLGAGNAGNLFINVGVARIVTTGPATVFGVVQGAFSGGTMQAYGLLRASRV